MLQLENFKYMYVYTYKLSQTQNRFHFLHAGAEMHHVRNYTPYSVHYLMLVQFVFCGHSVAWHFKALQLMLHLLSMMS